MEEIHNRISDKFEETGERIRTSITFGVDLVLTKKALSSKKRNEKYYGASYHAKSSNFETMKNILIKELSDVADIEEKDNVITFRIRELEK